MILLAATCPEQQAVHPTNNSMLASTQSSFYNFLPFYQDTHHQDQFQTLTQPNLQNVPPYHQNPFQQQQIQQHHALQPLQQFAQQYQANHLYKHNFYKSSSYGSKPDPQTQDQYFQAPFQQQLQLHQLSGARTGLYHSPSQSHQELRDHNFAQVTNPEEQQSSQPDSTQSRLDGKIK